MKIQQLFENEQILLEAQYEDMFSDKFIEVSKIFNPNFSKTFYDDKIKWAKRNLKKNDRIVWFLRWSKVYAIKVILTSSEVNKPYLVEFNIKFGSGEKLDFTTKALYDFIDKELSKIKSSVKLNMRTIKQVGTVGEQLIMRLDHYMSLDIAAIQNHVWGNETPAELINIFHDAEKEWKETRKRLIPDDPDLTKMIEMGDFVWFDLESPFCDIEAGAMGHCGNSPNSSDRNQTILSLRQKKEVSGETWWKPVATFILHKKEGMLGEMKGFGNDKPESKYHSYIVKLLEHKRIKGIKGGGYLPESNFSVNDLDDATRDKLVKKKPLLMTFGERIEVYGINDEMIKEMKDAGLKFDSSNNLLMREYKDIVNMVDDHGDRTSKWIIGIFNGDEHLNDDYTWSSTDQNMLESNMKKEQITKIKEYVQEKYPEELENNDDDWFETLNQEDEDTADEFRRAASDAADSGTQSEMWDDFKRTYKNGMSNDDFYVFFEPTEPVFDTPIKAYMPLENLKDVIKVSNEYIQITSIEDLKDAHGDFFGYDMSEGFKVDEPRYGWGGFDEEYFQQFVDDILGELK